MAKPMPVRIWLHDWVHCVQGCMPPFLADILDAEVESAEAATRLVALRIENYRMWLDGIKPVLPIDIRMGLSDEDYQDILLRHHAETPHPLEAR